uniref:Pleckstrin homology and RhoGEF domain containing G3 n=2 Tax=Eptatretus burgeri TaxID=7764 RepID=A0A8C4NIZ4_EPTBU
MSHHHTAHLTNVQPAQGDAADHKSQWGPNDRTRLEPAFASDSYPHQAHGNHKAESHAWNGMTYEHGLSKASVKRRRDEVTRWRKKRAPGGRCVSLNSQFPIAIQSLVSQSPQLSHIDRVVIEILDTEHTYVRDVLSIIQGYYVGIIETPALQLNPGQIQMLFGNITDIYEFNNDLLQNMEKCNQDPVEIARCFMTRSKEFHIYSQYCMNLPNAMSLLNDCMRRKTLSRFFHERQARNNHGLSLASYLLKPFQRIIKYRMLFQEMLKHADKGINGYSIIEDANMTMYRVAWYTNDMRRKQEYAIRAQEMQQLMVNCKTHNLSEFGELVLEGTFRMHRSKKERTLFLFNKALLITKKRDDGAFIYKTHLECQNLMLQEAKVPSFTVWNCKNAKTKFSFQVKFNEEKKRWIHHMKKLMLESHPHVLPARAMNVILDMDQIADYPVSQIYQTPSRKVSLKERRKEKQLEPPSHISQDTGIANGSLNNRVDPIVLREDDFKNRRECVPRPETPSQYSEMSDYETSSCVETSADELEGEGEADLISLNVSGRSESFRIAMNNKPHQTKTSGDILTKASMKLDEHHYDSVEESGEMSEDSTICNTPPPSLELVGERSVDGDTFGCLSEDDTPTPSHHNSSDSEEVHLEENYKPHRRNLSNPTFHLKPTSEVWLHLRDDSLPSSSNNKLQHVEETMPPKCNSNFPIHLQRQSQLTSSLSRTNRNLIEKIKRFHSPVAQEPNVLTNQALCLKRSFSEKNGNGVVNVSHMNPHVLENKQKLSFDFIKEAIPQRLEIPILPAHISELSQLNQQQNSELAGTSTLQWEKPKATGIFHANFADVEPAKEDCKEKQMCVENEFSKSRATSEQSCPIDTKVVRRPNRLSSHLENEVFDDMDRLQKSPSESVPHVIMASQGEERPRIWEPGRLPAQSTGSTDEDGKRMSKVFQMARKYSMRIKSSQEKGNVRTSVLKRQHLQRSRPNTVLCTDEKNLHHPQSKDDFNTKVMEIRGVCTDESQTEEDQPIKSLGAAEEDVENVRIPVETQTSLLKYSSTLPPNSTTEGEATMHWPVVKDLRSRYISTTEHLKTEEVPDDGVNPGTFRMLRMLSDVGPGGINVNKYSNIRPVEAITLNTTPDDISSWDQQASQPNSITDNIRHKKHDDGCMDNVTTIPRDRSHDYYTCYDDFRAVPQHNGESSHGRSFYVVGSPGNRKQHITEIHSSNRERVISIQPASERWSGDVQRRRQGDLPELGSSVRTGQDASNQGRVQKLREKFQRLGSFSNV